ncbi:MAG: DNA polymerase III subunit beta [Candidatus Dependentiae bacterium]
MTMQKNSFVVDQKPFMGILSSMQPICTKRTTLDATSYIYFQVGHKELVLKSTDLEISLQASYIFKDGDIAEPRSFLVPGKRIFDLVKELDGEIKVTVDATQLKLNAGTARLALHIKDAQEFPPFPERIENLMELDAPFLLDMISKVAFLVPQNNANPSLNGLFLEISDSNMKMTSTDGHCLAQVSTDKYRLDEPKKWLLPRRAIFEVKKILEASSDKAVFLGVCNNQLVFSGESFNFFTKLLVDSFPEYQAILNKDGFVAARVDRTHLIKTLRRSSCLLSGQFIATQFAFKPESLNISMQNKEVGALDEHVALENFSGQALDVRFYAPYLLSGLQTFGDDKLDFHLKNSSKPIIFELNEKESNLLYLVMPVSPTQAQQ